MDEGVWHFDFSCAHFINKILNEKLMGTFWRLRFEKNDFVDSLIANEVSIFSCFRFFIEIKGSWELKILKIQKCYKFHISIFQ